MRTLAIILFAAACTGSGEVRYSAQAEVTTPEMVEVEPGVQVVADYDEPVFYNEGFYWRYYGGVWYRSPQYNRAWVRVDTVPVAVRHIDRPERFAHYRAQGHVEARDHREPQPVAPPPGQVRREEVREHREEAREHREEEHQIKHDEKEVGHDRGEIRHDQKELDRDHREIEHDKARGDQKELDRDRREEKRDQREMGRDKKELDKDQKKERKDKDKH